MKNLFRRKSTKSGSLRHSKRVVAMVVALLLALSISSAALADGGTGQGGMPRQSGQPGRVPQNSPDPSGDGQSQQNGQGEERNMEMSGPNLEKIEAAISALTDEAAKETLLALLDAYEAALDAKQAAVKSNDTADLGSLSAAVSDAKAALDAALTEAGIATDELYGVPELAQDGTGRMENRPALNTDEISAAIEALDDTDANKIKLSALLGAYEDARKAQNGADPSAMTQEEIGASNDATNRAEQALMEALKNAGISDEPIREQNRLQISANQPESADENQYQFSVVSEEPADGVGVPGNLFTSFFQWLNTLFK